MPLMRKIDLWFNEAKEFYKSLHSGAIGRNRCWLGYKEDKLQHSIFFQGVWQVYYSRIISHKGIG
jgi:hypothetical protein